ncbi:MAG: hypothetical protein GY754_07200, partial [bacterium]|nr:hypothetical protein [bacterium]
KAVIEALTGDSLDTSNSLTTRISDLESSVATLEGMNSTFAGVTRLTDSETGQPTIRFSGVNVQIVNGLGFTNGVDDNSDSAGTVNGLGNLIVGYNKRTGGYDTKSGSHNIIVGSHHYYSSYGGLVVGYSNYMSGKYSSVSGGSECRAINDYSSVSGGRNNFANGDYSSVKGGWANWATGEYSSINGGWQCQASGNRSTVSGGQRRGASGAFNWRGGDYSSEF